MQNTGNTRPVGTRYNERHCPVCGELVDYWEVVDIGEYPFHRFCACERKAQAASKVDRLRKAGVSDPLFASMRFEADDGESPDACGKVRRYVKHWDEMRADGTGLLLYGGVGTGKTFLAACVCNALIERGVSAIMSTSAAIIRTPFHAWDERVHAIEEADLFVLDDFGAERSTDFVGERLFDVVDARIRAAAPLIVTTNLAPHDFTQADDIQHRRIFDRILGACVPVEIVGQSRRIKEKANRLEKARAVLFG